MRDNIIRFGTSGWRAVIAEDFTFANVRLAVAAIARYLLSRKPSGASLVVGYDTRFFSDDFAHTAVEVLSAEGIRAFLCSSATPTPAISYEVLRRGTNGAINFTASHNPPEYNGLKFSTSDGAPALPEVTRRIEEIVAELRSSGQTQPVPEGKKVAAETMDPKPSYLATLREKVRLDAIRDARLTILYDPMHGAGSGYLDGLLLDSGIQFHTIHANRDVLFGGGAPDPSEERLETLRAAVLAHKAQLGLATDGDADRFGILDADGTFIHPNYIIALLLDYLIETRGWPGGVARSVATTHLIDAVAAHCKIPLYETPVGFKYIGELIKQDKIVIGGEESAGLSIYRHVPEKDGILACLLTAEMVAHRRASLGEQLETLFRKVGAYYPVRINLRLPGDVQKRLLERLMQDPAQFNGRKVVKIDRTDGLKMVLEDGSWALMRMSGTEPVCRCYCETRTREDLEPLIAAVRSFIFD